MISTHCLVIHYAKTGNTATQFFPDLATATERSRLIQGAHDSTDPVDTYVTEIVARACGQRQGIAPAPNVDPDDHYDFDAAFAEGWAISQAGGNCDGTAWRLESMEDVGLIRGDRAAAAHVVARAKAGGTNHANALRFLKTFEPFEYATVIRMAKESGVE